MASSPAVPQSVDVVPAAKVPLVPLLLISVVTVVLAVGGTAFAVLRVVRPASGRAAGAEPEAKKTPAKPPHLVSLEPMLVNLADEGGHAYLRASVVLSEAAAETDGKKAEGAKPVPGADAAVRDTILSVLGRQTSETLLTPNGRDGLKATLKEALAEQNHEAAVEAVYFTDFLVQR